MADLRTHIVEILDKYPPGGVEVPSSADVAQEILAEVHRHRHDLSGRVPAGTLRRPDHPAQRQPGEDLGTEALPQ